MKLINSTVLLLTALALACSSSKSNAPAAPTSPAPQSDEAATRTQTPTPSPTAALVRPAPAENTEAQEHSAALEAPFHLAVEGPKTVLAGTEIEIGIKISVNRPLNGPLNLTASLPAGATLVAGSERETFTNLARGLTERRLRLRLEQVPSTDLLVKLSYRGPTSGATAKKRYRFGRTASTKPIPRNRVIKGMGGVRLGAPVPLKRVGTRPPRQPKP